MLLTVGMEERIPTDHPIRRITGLERKRNEGGVPLKVRGPRSATLPQCGPAVGPLILWALGYAGPFPR